MHILQPMELNSVAAAGNGVYVSDNGNTYPVYFSGMSQSCVDLFLTNINFMNLANVDYSNFSQSTYEMCGEGAIDFMLFSLEYQTGI